MFNFFDEIKKSSPLDSQILNDYQIINISSRLLYVEGHQGLVVLSKEEVVFRVKGGRLSVEGEGLILNELTDKTLTIAGKIKRVEAQE